MQYRPLGNTGLSVSTVALGCWAITGDFTWGRQAEDESLRTIATALDEGINLFDTAEVYGDGSSETMLGKALASRRNDVIIASKVHESNLAPDALTAACEASLQRLNTDYIDVYQIHWPLRETPWEDTWSALDQLKAQGKVRHVAVSNFGGQDLDDLQAMGHTTPSNQLIYSLLSRAIEFATQPRCVERGIGILCYSPLAQGLLTGKFASADDVPLTRARSRHFSRNRKHTRHDCDGCETETFAAIARVQEICDALGEPMADVALAWCLHQPAITSVLAGGRKPEQVKQNVRAAGLKLDENTLTALSAATERVKTALGPSLDLWEAPEKSRSR